MSPDNFASPYRSAPIKAQEPPVSISKTEWVANRLVVGLALLRVAMCTVHGLDIEGVIALVIVCRSLA